MPEAGEVGFRQALGEGGPSGFASVMVAVGEMAFCLGFCMVAVLFQYPRFNSCHAGLGPLDEEGVSLLGFVSCVCWGLLHLGAACRDTSYRRQYPFLS